MMNFTLVVQDFRTFKYFVREKLRVFSLRGFSYVRGKGGDDLSPPPPPHFSPLFCFSFFFLPRRAVLGRKFHAKCLEKHEAHRAKEAVARYR